MNNMIIKDTSCLRFNLWFNMAAVKAKMLQLRFLICQACEAQDFVLILDKHGERRSSILVTMKFPGVANWRLISPYNALETVYLLSNQIYPLTLSAHHIVKIKCSPALRKWEKFNTDCCKLHLPSSVAGGTRFSHFLPRRWRQGCFTTMIKQSRRDVSRIFGVEISAFGVCE